MRRRRRRRDRSGCRPRRGAPRGRAGARRRPAAQVVGRAVAARRREQRRRRRSPSCGAPGKSATGISSMAVTPRSRSSGRRARRGGEGAVRREGADVQLVDHQVAPARRRASGGRPGEASRVDHLRRPVHAVGLDARGGIGERALAVEPVPVAVAGARRRRASPAKVPSARRRSERHAVAPAVRRARARRAGVAAPRRGSAVPPAHRPGAERTETSAPSLSRGGGSRQHRQRAARAGGSAWPRRARSCAPFRLAGVEHPLPLQVGRCAGSRKVCGSASALSSSRKVSSTTRSPRSSTSSMLVATQADHERAHEATRPRPRRSSPCRRASNQVMSLTSEPRMRRPWKNLRRRNTGWSRRSAISVADEGEQIALSSASSSQSSQLISLSWQ